jgi:hypothetical protein
MFCQAKAWSSCRERVAAFGFCVECQVPTSGNSGLVSISSGSSGSGTGGDFPSQSARAIRWEVRPRLEMMVGQCHSRPALLLRALEAMHPSWLALTGSPVSLNRGSGANGLGGSTARLAADGMVTSTSAVMPSLAQLKHSTQVQLHHAFPLARHGLLYRIVLLEMSSGSVGETRGKALRQSVSCCKVESRENMEEKRRA